MSTARNIKNTARNATHYGATLSFISIIAAWGNIIIYIDSVASLGLFYRTGNDER